MLTGIRRCATRLTILRLVAGSAWGAATRRATLCHMLITRGDVYMRMSVDFRSHDNCMCSAESVFHSIKSDQMREFERSLRHSTGRHDEQKVYERARARELLELGGRGAPLTQVLRFSRTVNVLRYGRSH